ncbi:peptidoglycan-binding protein [Streptomyces sp. NPDC056486]|uniref:peptidoglycan-binding domain-containing protein n=1 Tax=Streptomyces sp. NPDC056486 TaxID=3345835 RepID=UPI0036C75351
MSFEAAVPDPSMYPALSSYLTRTPDRRLRTAFGVPRPVAGPTYATPASAAPTSGREGKGRHRAAASIRGQPRLHTHARHGAIRPRRCFPPLTYGYASAALLVLTAGLLAQSHGRPAPTSPHAAPPARQPDAPRHESAPVPDKAPSTPPSKPAPHPSPPASTLHDTPHARADPAADNASSALRVGSTGDSVRQLQEQLGQLRLYTGPVDGHYSQDVAAAVARIQQARAIDEPLGVYGPGTRNAISTAAM